MRWHPPTCLRVFVFAALATLLAPAAVAQSDDALLVGKLTDSQGLPLTGFRVVARVVDTPTVFVSPPSDETGMYAIELPSGATYTLVAVVSPRGNRIPLAEEIAVDIGEDQVTRDVTIDLEIVPSRRSQLPRGEEGLGRLFLQLVEDPDVLQGGYVEVGLAAAEADSYDRRGAYGIFAYRPVPRVELGIRAGGAKIDGPSFDDSGVTDTDVWAKLNLHAAPTGRYSVTAGSLVTLPTADADFGLGQDTVQSKLFVSGSWAAADLVLTGHVGARVTGDATVGGAHLDGRTSLSAGLGVLVPALERLYLSFEGRHDGERFENVESEARASVGMAWRPPAIPGVLRGAVLFGIDDGAPDSEVTVGWALGY